MINKFRYTEYICDICDRNITKKKKNGVSSKRGRRVAPSMQVQNCHSCQLLIDEDSQGYADKERTEDRR